ncbi:MAG: hypothetical protein ACYDH5_10600 [Acidimicrobiales bacterium]
MDGARVTGARLDGRGSPAAPAATRGVASRRRGGRPVAAAMRSGRGPGSWQGAAALTAYLAMGLAWFWPAWASPATTFVGSHGDTDQFMWFLGWLPYAVSHLQSPLISHQVYLPEGVNLAWNTSVPLLSAALAPVTELLGTVFAYNVFATAGPALSACCAYLAFSRYTGRPAAFAGAAFFGFSPYVAAQSLGHPDLTFLASAPLLMIVLDRLFLTQRRPAWVDGVLLGLVAGAQLLVAEDVLADEAIAVAVTVAVLVLAAPRAVPPRLIHTVKALAVSLVVFGAIAAWPLSVQFLGPGPITHAVHTPGVYVSDLASFAVPTAMMHFAPPSAVSLTSRFTGNLSEWGSYLGVPMLVLLLVAALSSILRPAGTSRRAMLVPIAIALVLEVLSMGPTLHVAGRVTSLPLPWALVGGLPVARDILPSRLSPLADLIVGLVLAQFLDRAFSPVAGGRQAPVAGGRQAPVAGGRQAPVAGGRQAPVAGGRQGPHGDHRRHRRSPVLAAGAAGLAGLSLAAVLPAFPALSPGAAYLTTKSHVPAAFANRSLCSVPGHVVMVVPLISERVMHWQQVSGYCFSMPGGYLLRATRDRLPVPATRGGASRPAGGPATRGGPSPPAGGPPPVPPGSPSIQPASIPLLTDIVAFYHGGTLPALTPPVRAIFTGDLRSLGVGAIVLAPLHRRPGMAAWLSGIAGHGPRREGSLLVWRTGTGAIPGPTR